MRRSQCFTQQKMCQWRRVGMLFFCVILVKESYMLCKGVLLKEIFPRCSCWQMPLAKKWSNSQPVFRKVWSDWQESSWRLFCEVCMALNIKYLWIYYPYRLKNAFRQNAGHYECSGDITHPDSDDHRCRGSGLIKFLNIEFRPRRASSRNSDFSRGIFIDVLCEYILKYIFSGYFQELQQNPVYM